MSHAPAEPPPTLQYDSGARQHPGLVTAIGVLSVVFGALLSLFNTLQLVNIVRMYIDFQNFSPPSGSRLSPTVGTRILYHLIPQFVDHALGAVLAAYLLTIGILTLRNSRRSPTLHRIYAWIKIPLALAFAAIIYGPYITRAWSSTNSNPYAAWLPIELAIAVALPLAYPVALLIALRTRRIRDYYLHFNSA